MGAALEFKRQILVVNGRRPVQNVFCPAPGGNIAKPMPVVFHQQRIDMGDIADDLAIIGPAPQRHQRPADDIGKAPGKFPERGGVALGRQLIGNAGGDFGNP